MSSPFASYANATLTFYVPDGSKTVQDDYGNEHNRTKPFIVTALLEPVSSGLRETKGGDDATRKFKGTLVEPLSLPSSIRPGMTANMELKETGDRTVSGTFTLKPSVADPYVVGAGVDILNPIVGEFRVAA